MKKIAVVLLCIVMVVPFATIASANGVDGLQGKMDALFMKNQFATTEIGAMNQRFSNSPDAQSSRYTLDFDSAVRMTPFIVQDYVLQYMTAGSLGY